jgi:hypothetical protein
MLTGSNPAPFNPARPKPTGHEATVWLAGESGRAVQQENAVT